MIRGEETRLTEVEIEAIAELAAEKALQKVYAEVGQSVVKKLLWLVGAAAVAFAMWLSGKGLPVFK